MPTADGHTVTRPAVLFAWRRSTARLWNHRAHVFQGHSSSECGQVRRTDPAFAFGPIPPSGKTLCQRCNYYATYGGLFETLNQPNPA